MSEIDENIFIESDKYLQSATSFEQFINSKDNRLITIIGELHMKEFSCQTENEISVSKYAIDRYKQNNKTKILLEYFIGNDPSSILSIPIQEITKEFGNKLPVIPYDDRTWWIGYQNQLKLYYEDSKNKLFKIKDISNEFLLNTYVKPFFEKNREEGFYLNKYQYDEKEYNFLKINYYNYINNQFLEIHKNLTTDFKFKKGRGNETSQKMIKRKSIIKILREIWKNVTDFYILREIFKKDINTNEVIIITGEAHRKNISQILKNVFSKNYTSINTQLNKDKDNCVKIFVVYNSEQFIEEEKQNSKIIKVQWFDLEKNNLMELEW